MKISTLSVDFPGAKRPLQEGAKLGLWNYIPLTQGSVRIPDSDVYILGAWHPLYKMFLGVGIKIGVMWTSSIGEMDFTPIEIEYLKKLNDDERVSFIWFGDSNLAKIFPKKSFYLPYPFYFDDSKYALENTIHVNKKLKPPSLSLFGPVGPKKNILNTLFGVKLSQILVSSVLHHHIDPKDGIYSLIGVGGEFHDWLPEEDYYTLVRNCWVNLAPSWCETFNYQVAESNLLGTPSIISPTIPLPGIRVSNPNSSTEISEAISKLLYSTSSEYSSIQLQVYLDTRNKLATNNNIVRQGLDKQLKAVLQR